MIINNEHKFCRAFGQLLKTRNTKNYVHCNNACLPQYLCPSGGSNSEPTALEASALPLSYRPPNMYFAYPSTTNSAENTLSCLQLASANCVAALTSCDGILWVQGIPNVKNRLREFIENAYY